MTIPRILFVADSGPDVGGGHVMRSLTLAKALERAGAEAVFAAPPAAARVLQAFGPPSGGAFSIEGGDAAALAAQVLEVARSIEAAAVVIDHYGFAAVHEEPFRARAKVAVIDDLADRSHACELLIDPGMGQEPEAYGPLAPGAKVLSGPSFALVRPEFAALREESLARRAKGGPVRRALISLGLTDVGGITREVLQGILPDRGAVAFDLVLGAGSPSLDWARGLEGEGLRVHVNTQDMARLMADADIAIGAGGSSVWERATLGLPSVLVVLAENQHRSAAELANLKAAEAIRHDALAFEAMLSAAWYALLASPEERAALSANSSALCDGQGAERVAAEVMALV